MESVQELAKLMKQIQNNVTSVWTIYLPAVSYFTTARINVIRISTKQKNINWEKLKHILINKDIWTDITVKNTYYSHGLFTSSVSDVCEASSLALTWRHFRTCAEPNASRKDYYYLFICLAYFTKLHLNVI